MTLDLDFVWSPGLDKPERSSSSLSPSRDGYPQLNNENTNTQNNLTMYIILLLLSTAPWNYRALSTHYQTQQNCTDQRNTLLYLWPAPFFFEQSNPLWR